MGAVRRAKHSSQRRGFRPQVATEKDFAGRGVHGNEVGAPGTFHIELPGRQGRRLERKPDKRNGNAPQSGVPKNHATVSPRWVADANKRALLFETQCSKRSLDGGPSVDRGRQVGRRKWVRVVVESPNAAFAVEVNRHVGVEVGDPEISRSKDDVRQTRGPAFIARDGFKV